MESGPLLVAALLAGSVLLGFVGLWRVLQVRDPILARLKEIGADVGQDDASERPQEGRRRRTWSAVGRLLAGFGLGPRLATALMRADIPLTAAEFAVIIFSLGAVGFVLGALRAGVAVGLLLGAVVGFVPIFYLRSRQGRRLRAFAEQLPDILTLLVGALRAGYGLQQSFDMVIEHMPPPTSTEFARVKRAVELGLPVQRALDDMAGRVGSDDLALVVTAITVQYEMGGNLAQTLDTIGATVRDRLRILREIRVLTAQQRLTGYFLAVWPVVVALIMFLINPTYIRILFQPGWVRLLPITAVIMQILGFLVIRRIVDIEV